MTRRHDGVNARTGQQWLALIVLRPGTLAVLLDTTIANVALPSLVQRPARAAGPGEPRLPLADVLGGI